MGRTGGLRERADPVPLGEGCLVGIKGCCFHLGLSKAPQTAPSSRAFSPAPESNSLAGGTALLVGGPQWSGTGDLHCRLPSFNCPKTEFLLDAREESSGGEGTR